MNNELREIFNKLKEILKRYENPLVSKVNLDGNYDLWSVKDIVIEGRKKNEVYFAGLIIQSNYVAFYYMPIYAEPKMKGKLGSELLKLLKGKSCFHIKKLNEKLEKQITEVVETGYLLYKEKGWI